MYRTVHEHVWRRILSISPCFFPVECLCCYDMWGASSGLAAQFFIAKESVEAHEDADWRINSGKQETIALILIFYTPKAFLIHVELYSNIHFQAKPEGLHESCFSAILYMYEVFNYNHCYLQLILWYYQSWWRGPEMILYSWGNKITVIIISVQDDKNY